MTDMIAGKDISCSDRNLSEINNLRPADQEKDPLEPASGSDARTLVAPWSFRACFNRE